MNVSRGAMQTVISWAASAVGADNAPCPNAIGPPDGHSYPITDANPRVTLSDFRPVAYSGLLDVLSTAQYGDRVTPEMLMASDLLTFEHNGDAPGPSGGWESCDWQISDGANAIAFHWDTASVANPSTPGDIARDPHVVANGSISGAVFGAYFGISDRTVLAENPAAPSLDDVVISFLLLRLRPDIDLASPGISVSISVAQTPDIDGLGVLTHLVDAPDYAGFETCRG